MNYKEQYDSLRRELNILLLAIRIINARSKVNVDELISDLQGILLRHTDE